MLFYIHSHLMSSSKEGTTKGDGGFYLQRKAKCCPGRRSVGRIILHRGLVNCYELFNSDDNLLDHVSEDDSLAITLSKRPELLCAGLSFLLCFFQGLGEYVTTAGFRQVKTIPELDR